MWKLSINNLLFFQTSAPGCREADGLPDHAGEQQHVKVLSNSSHAVSDQRSGGSALAGLPGKHPHCFTTHALAFPLCSSSSFSFGSTLIPFYLIRCLVIVLSLFLCVDHCSYPLAVLPKQKLFHLFSIRALLWSWISLPLALLVYFSLAFSPIVSFLSFTLCFMSPFCSWRASLCARPYVQTACPIDSSPRPLLYRHNQYCVPPVPRLPCIQTSQ